MGALEILTEMAMTSGKAAGKMVAKVAEAGMQQMGQAIEGAEGLAENVSAANAQGAKAMAYLTDKATGMGGGKQQAAKGKDDGLEM